MPTIPFYILYHSDSQSQEFRLKGTGGDEGGQEMKKISLVRSYPLLSPPVPFKFRERGISGEDS